MWIPAVIFASVLILFLIGAFFRTPHLTPDQRDIVLLLFALLAGFSTFFLGGAALLELTGEFSQGVRLSFSATAGIAVFVFCYLQAPYFFQHRSDEKPESDDLPAATPSGGSVENSGVEHREDERPDEAGCEIPHNEPKDRQDINGSIPAVGPSIEQHQDVNVDPAPAKRVYVTREKTADRVLKRICRTHYFSDQDQAFEDLFKDRWMKLSGELAEDPIRYGKKWWCYVWEKNTRARIDAETADDMSCARSGDGVDIDGRIAEFVRDREGEYGRFTGIVRICLRDAKVKVCGGLSDSRAEADPSS